MLASLKRFLLKVIDLTALGFLEPVVRLCYGEEPKVQLKKIGQFVVVPILAFIMFLGIWAYVAPRHTTKYGAVPTPQQTWNGWVSAVEFNRAESAKEEAFLAEGDAREKLLTYALGRGLEHYDMPAVRRIVREAAADDYRFQTIVTRIAGSYPFRHRRAGGAAGAAATAASR